MRAILQRVQQARVEVQGNEVGSCEKGLLIFLGVGTDDTCVQAERLWDKIKKLRIFSDKNGKTNLSLVDVEGDVLIISQFTLFADSRKGNRPSFTDAARPELANNLYQYFCGLARHDIGETRVGEGVFGADMSVSLINDGPFTIALDTNDFPQAH